MSKSKDKKTFTATELNFKGDDTVPTVYSNFAKVSAQAHDITVMFTHITGLPGIHGFRVGEEDGDVEIRPNLLLTLPQEVGAGLAKALILQLKGRGFDLESVFAPEGVSIGFKEDEQDTAEA